MGFGPSVTNMKTVVRFDPFNELRRFSQLWDETQTAPQSQLIPVDLFDDGDNFFVRASVPGIAPDALEVTIEKDVLTLRGEHATTTTVEGTKFYRQEVGYGMFTRSVRLPDTIDSEHAVATHENGVVTVRFPHRDEVKPRALTIQVKTSEPNNN